MRNLGGPLSLFLIGIVYVLSVYFYKPYNDMYHQDGGDAFGYYVYLPSFLIHHDLKDLHTTMAAKYSHTAPGRKAEDKYFNKYFSGTAVLQAPFFLVAHILAGYMHQPQDGFSTIYMYAVQFSAIVYALLALFFILLILRRRFSDGVTAMVLLIIGLGTNLYYMVCFQPPFCHPYLFFWYSLLIFFTIKFYDSLKPGFILLIGLACGMIILTRFNELYVVLIPLLWGINARKDIAERLKLGRRFIFPVFGAGVIMILCIIPQFLYWKISTGHYFYYSYQSEKFDFLHPHILGGLFGCNNGWLVYSPVMILALAGIWHIIRHRDVSCVSLIVFLTIHIYVIYSWWCWFYMGSYGSRPMTETYPLLSIPLAYTVEWFWQWGARRMILVFISAFCIWLVMFQTYQSYLNIFNSELSNWHFNLITFGKAKLTYEEAIVLDTKEFQPHEPVFVKTLGENNFDDPSVSGSDTSVSTSGHRSVCVHLGQICKGYEATRAQTGATPCQWVKASINCLAKQATDHNWHLSSLVMAFTRKGKMTKWCTVSLQNKIDNPMHRIWNFPVNKWGRVYFYSQLPSDMTTSDTISVYVENIHDGPDIYIDDLKVELYNEK